MTLSTSKPLGQAAHALDKEGHDEACVKSARTHFPLAAVYDTCAASTPRELLPRSPEDSKRDNWLGLCNEASLSF